MFKAPAVVILASFLVAGRLLLFIWRYAVNIPFWDQWDFLGLLFTPNPRMLDLFLLQQGPPREGLGLIATSVLYRLTSWNVRADSLAIGICVIGAMFLAIFLKWRLFHRLTYWDVLIPLIFGTLSQYETFLRTPNLAYSGFPLVFIMLYALALSIGNEMVKLAVLLTLNLALIYTGFGFFMGPVTIGVFGIYFYRALSLTAADRIRSLAGFLLSIGSLAVFFVNYVFQPAVDCFEFPARDLMAYPWFVSLMFTMFSGIKSPLLLVTILGGIFLVGSLWVMGAQVLRVLRPAQDNRAIHLTIGVLAAYSLLFCFNTAVGRVCIGLPVAAQNSRYTTLLIPAFLALYFYVVTIPSQRWKRILLPALGIVLLPGHLHVPSSVYRELSNKKQWANCYKQTQDIRYCDSATNSSIYPDPERTHLKEKLDYLQRNRLSLFSDSENNQ